MKNVNSDIAYDYMRKRILSGEYPPGYALMTNALSSEIGVSRTPVRDALRQLEADGLVSIKARLGASVKAMDMKEFREMCGLRLALESHAAGLAAKHRSEADLQEIGYALEEMRRLTAQIVTSDQEEAFMADLVREDVRFHIAIMTAGKNDLMKKEILRLHLINRVVSGLAPADPARPAEAEQLSREDRDARRQAVLASHQEIYEAIVRQDAPAAKEAMARHIEDIVDHNLKTMARAANKRIAKELSEDELIYTTS